MGKNSCSSSRLRCGRSRCRTWRPGSSPWRAGAGPLQLGQERDAGGDAHQRLVARVGEHVLQHRRAHRSRADVVDLRDVGQDAADHGPAAPHLVVGQGGEQPARRGAAQVATELVGAHERPGDAIGVAQLPQGVHDLQGHAVTGAAAGHHLEPAAVERHDHPGPRAHEHVPLHGLVRERDPLPLGHVRGGVADPEVVQPLAPQRVEQGDADELLKPAEHQRVLKVERGLAVRDSGEPPALLQLPRERRQPGDVVHRAGPQLLLGDQPCRQLRRGGDVQIRHGHE